MKIRQSAEDYLETMLVLQEEFGYIRSVDIACRLGVTMPSVSYATRRLREKGYINMVPHGPITLTPAGLEKAKRTYGRHTTLTAFLEQIGVSSGQAAEDACRMGHVISQETFEAICSLMEVIAAEGAEHNG